MVMSDTPAVQGAGAARPPHRKLTVCSTTTIAFDDRKLSYEVVERGRPVSADSVSPYRVIRTNDWSGPRLVGPCLILELRNSFLFLKIQQPMESVQRTLLIAALVGWPT
jgi:hypothetical protein